VDYAQHVKLYGTEGGKNAEVRYSPAECAGIRKRLVEGNPDVAHVHVARPRRTSTSNA
jgi:hypothetical protein